MKIKTFRSIAAFLTAGCALVALVGCAEMEATNTKSLLTTAGFHSMTPQTARQKEVYAALTANKVERATVNGKVFYVFKDEEAGVAYVGHEPEYQRYRELAIHQKIAQDYYMAVQMDRMSARGWYGAYGARGMYW